ncbi:MAG: hypothetical protein GF355_17700 [Candidatus Eisenbacteria bacterium]|nr:hypothetical protein [Candidatus Eisenbacteria bacterium]
MIALIVRETVAGAVLPRAFIVLFLAIQLVAPAVAVAQASGEQDEQVLFNPEFELPTNSDGDPPGWSRVVFPERTTGLQVGVVRDEGGSYTYIEQERAEGNVLNHWAQRIECPPRGTVFLLEAEIATEGMADSGGFVGVIIRDRRGEVLQIALPEEIGTITGTTDWQRFSVGGIFPGGCADATVRVGLTNGGGRIKARSVKLFLSEPSQHRDLPGEAIEETAPESGTELLVNGDFEAGTAGGDPVGWFRAMRPDMAVGHSAGVVEIPGRGNVAFIEQGGVTNRVFNNWAQRLTVVPPGARLRLSADVATEDLPAGTGAFMAQCWDQDAVPQARLLDLFTTQHRHPIDGTRDWRTISIEFTVPPATDAIIVRCGMAESGRISFDNVSVTLLEPAPTTKPANDAESSTGGRFYLNRVTRLSEDLLRDVQESLGSSADLRHEVRAKGDEEYEIVLHVAFRDPGGPGPERKHHSGPANLDLEQGERGEVPKGWFLPAALRGAGFSAELTDKQPKEGDLCAVLRHDGKPTEGSFGNLMQTVAAEPYGGRDVRLRAAVRVSPSEPASRAQLWLRVDRTHGATGFFDNMYDRPIRDDEWAYYEITGPVADDAEDINFGIILLGGGSVYLDDVSLESVPQR